MQFVPAMADSRWSSFSWRLPQPFLYSCEPPRVVFQSPSSVILRVHLFVPIVGLAFAHFASRRTHRGFHRELAQGFLVPVHMHFFLTPDLADRLHRRALQLGVFNFRRNRRKHLPVPMILGLSQHEILDVVQVLHFRRYFRGYQTVGLMLRGLSTWTLKVGIRTDRLEHRGAKLDVPMGLAQKLGQFVFEFRMLEIAQRSLVEFHAALFHREHLRQKIPEPFGADRGTSAPASAGVRLRHSIVAGLVTVV